MAPLFKVTWLACWVENIAGNYKYVMLNSATKLKVMIEIKTSTTKVACIASLNVQYYWIVIIVNSIHVNC